MKDWQFKVFFKGEGFILDRPVSETGSRERKGKRERAFATYQ